MSIKCVSPTTTICRSSYGCTNVVITGSNYCWEHVCIVSGCLNERYPNWSRPKLKCTDHMCMFYDIQNDIPIPNFMGTLRRARDEGYCYKDVEPGSTRCHLHTCPKCLKCTLNKVGESKDGPKSIQPKYDYSDVVLCSEHQCSHTEKYGVNRCRNEVMDDRNTCFLHSCSDPTCNNGSRCPNHRCQGCKMKRKAGKNEPCKSCIVLKKTVETSI
jgi:hypothetical protein